jgi:deoxycytidylate deaminase
MTHTAAPKSSAPNLSAHDLSLLLQAHMVSQKSTRLTTMVGCALADPNGQMIALAHNGFPLSPGLLPTNADWLRKPWTDQYELHAEERALAEAAGHGYATQGASLYLTHFPCEHCCPALARAGIAEVILPESAKIPIGENWKRTIEDGTQFLADHRISLRYVPSGVTAHPDCDQTLCHDRRRQLLDRLGITDTLELQGVYRPVGHRHRPGGLADHPVVTQILEYARTGSAPLKGATVHLSSAIRIFDALMLISAGVQSVMIPPIDFSALPDQEQKNHEMERATELFTLAGIKILPAPAPSDGKMRIIPAE